MTGCYYQSIKRNLTTLLVGIALAGFFSWIYFDEESGGGFKPLILMLCGVVAAASGVWGLIQKDPAIEWDRSGIKLRRWVGVAEVPWSEVHDVTLKIVTIRGQDIKWLSVACEGGWFGARKVNVPLASLDIVAGSEETVVATVRQAWIATVGEAGAAMAAAGSNGWGANFYDGATASSAGHFDPDAAFARYQARTNGSEVEPAPAPGFGNRGEVRPATPVATPAQAMPTPAQPARPVFGRKAV